MRILISAYSCETGRGSEGEIGWRVVNQLARDHEVWVITRKNLKAVHDCTYLTEPRPSGLHFIYFDLPWIFRFYKKGKRFFLLYYYLWQIGVGFISLGLQKKNDFDVCHHLIGGMDWMPSGLAFTSIPFVWGPVGSENTNDVILRNLDFRTRSKEYLRLFVRWCMRNLDPFTRFTGYKSKVVLSHTIETEPKRYANKIKAFTQTGIENSSTMVNLKSGYERSAIFKLLFAGELKDWKGAKLAVLSALKFFEREPSAELTVVGDGPLESELRLLASNHPLGNKIHFAGRLSMSALANSISDADVFLYPSYHHGLSTVVLQSMLTGLPVVCIDGDATGRVVGDEAGITVRVGHFGSLDTDIALALSRLSDDEAFRQKLAKRAREMALNDFSYENLVKKINDVYVDVLECKSACR